MIRKKKNRKAILAVALAFTMMFSTAPAVALGEDGHRHDDNCGYKAERSCTHTEHNNACGFVEAVVAQSCQHDRGLHTDTCLVTGTAACDCGVPDGQHLETCASLNAPLVCNHTGHDGNCGYVEEVTGQAWAGYA